jgi:hypothetical protein
MDLMIRHGSLRATNSGEASSFPRRVLALRALARRTLLLSALLLPVLTSGRAMGQGIKWADLTLDQALAEAAAKKTMVLIDVWSPHCGSCGQMDIDLWDTPEGLKLANGFVPIKIETGSPAGRDLALRYPITGLPAIIFLYPDGKELDRVEGYVNKNSFLYQVKPLTAGVDPLIEMENRLAVKPDSLDLIFQVMERYLNRRRDADADSLYRRIIRVDVGNHRMFVERAIVRMARKAEYVDRDLAETLGYWKFMVEAYPTASSVGAAVDGAFKTMLSQGTGSEWPDWICPILEKNPNLGYLQRAAAMTALRAGFRRPCFAKAARLARDLGVGTAAYMDSVATVLDGGASPKP